MKRIAFAVRFIFCGFCSSNALCKSSRQARWQFAVALAVIDGAREMFAPPMRRPNVGFVERVTVAEIRAIAENRAVFEINGWMPARGVIAGEGASSEENVAARAVIAAHFARARRKFRPFNFETCAVS